jgi:hypothetical protein
VKREDQERLDALLAAVKAVTPADLHDKVIHRVRTSFKKMIGTAVNSPKKPPVLDGEWRDARALNRLLKGTIPGLDPKMHERIFNAVTARGVLPISKAELNDYIERLVNEFDYPKGITAEELYAERDKSVVGDMPLKTFKNKVTAARKK